MRNGFCLSSSPRSAEVSMRVTARGQSPPVCIAFSMAAFESLAKRLCKPVLFLSAWRYFRPIASPHFPDEYGWNGQFALVADREVHSRRRTICFVS
jgi:hypothetical protein